jgi:hypothetical protein
MIVYNYPDRCPSCQSEDLIPAMLDPGGGVEIPKDQQPFVCNACNVMWSETLITSKNWACYIALIPQAWMLPKGILVNTKTPQPIAAARKLLGIPEEVNHVVIPLQKVLDDGNEQAELVKKGAVKLWKPPSQRG